MCKGIHEITGKSGKYIQTLNNKMQTKFSDQFSFSFVISFFVHLDSWDGTEQIIIFVSYQNRQNSGLRNIKPNIGYKVYCNVYIQDNDQITILFRHIACEIKSVQPLVLE